MLHQNTRYINRCRHANNYPEIPTDLLAHKDPPKEIPVYEILLLCNAPSWKWENNLAKYKAAILFVNVKIEAIDIIRANITPSKILGNF